MSAILAPYASDHANPNGPGDARPTALKIIRDQGLDGSLVGKIFFISGGTNGIGVRLHAHSMLQGQMCTSPAKTSQEAKKSQRILPLMGRKGRSSFWR